MILSTVLGKEIPPISPNIVNGKKRSGVDVFKEERGREERSEYHVSHRLALPLLKDGSVSIQFVSLKH